MKKSCSLLLFTIMLVATLSPSSLNEDNKVSLYDDRIALNQDEKNAFDKKEVTITIQDIADFLQDKKEHYPFSDEFIEKYQQTSGGYIELAQKLGMVVSKEMHEPNQKWHFFDSWLNPSIEEGSLSWDSDAKSRVYNSLLCPELLLWIYEACDVSPLKVKAAKEVAEQGKVNKTHVSTIAKNMRGCVPWSDIESNILAYKNND